MKTTAKKWTEEESKIISEKYLQLSDAEIAQILDRTEKAVHSQRLKLDLHRTSKKIQIKKRNICYDDFEQIKIDFKSRGYELLSDETECSKSSSKLRYLCLKHKDIGELIISEHHFYEGKGCPYCGRERTNKSRESKWTDNDDKELCESKNFEYIKTEKIDGRHHIFFICKNHKDIGIQSMRRGNMNRECVHGCQYCANKNIPEWYIKDYLLKEYNIELLSNFGGMNSSIRCRCLKHDIIFDTTGRNAYHNGVGCPECSFKKRSDAKKIIKR